MIDDLLDIARITSNKLELRWGRVAISELLNAAVETSAPLIKQYGHKLIVKAPSEQMQVDGDLVRLAQVISNLLNNAAKYTKKGGRIWLTASRKGKTALIKVRDTGIGIPAETLPRIFEMFAQADRAKYGSAGGLGIGLTLVKRLVEMHGGTITVHSDGHDQGSEFVVRVPLAAAQTTGILVRTRGENHIKKAATGPLKILVVDDNLDSADSLGLLMSLLGNEVRIVHDGLAAVEAANEFRPRVVLLDIGLPKLNGYEAAKTIRQQPGGKEAVLIAVSGWGEDIDRQRSKNAGFDHHLVKPLDPDALTNLLAEL